MRDSYDTGTIARAVKRLNVGCGPCIAPGWLNADRVKVRGIDFACDIRAGLPVESNSVDYMVGMHLLQDLPYSDVLPVLCEFRRVLKPDGILRLGLPDLRKAMDAYARDDHRYFYVQDDDAVSIGSKLITQLTWYGSVRTPFTYDFIEEWLVKAGFHEVMRCPFKRTHSLYPRIVELDNRERESLFVEAMK